MICISDVDVYSHSSVTFLNYFCGFIDGRNALQPYTIWNIHLKPNINIHFLKFALLDNHWYCDYEYLRVSSNNTISTFCGNHLPWVHDASDTSVKIILRTQRAGTRNYQLELLYYAAYVPNYEHFVIFIKPSSLINMHLPNTEQNAFESFHFISNNRLDIMELEAINTCNKGQVVCYDGPGFKSPVLQFTYNQSVWKCLSSTFQMNCKFSRVNDVCTNGPRLHYHAIRARDHEVTHPELKKGGRVSACNVYPLEINESKIKGTTKYIYYHPGTALNHCILRFIKMDISFPYMLSEGNSCMYGGVYIIRSISSEDSEILSLCTSAFNLQPSAFYPPVKRHIFDLTNTSVIIIHYSEYSTERVLFYANYGSSYTFTPQSWTLINHLDLNQTYKEDTLSITVPSTGRIGSIQSYQLRLRNIHYINITFDAYVTIAFYSYQTTSCININIAIFYPQDLSNIRFIPDHYKEKLSFYDRRTQLQSLYTSIISTKFDFIQYVFINMSACRFVRAPVWTLYIKTTYKHGVLHHSRALAVYSYNFPAAVLRVLLWPRGENKLFVILHMQKPELLPVYTIWRVSLQAAPTELRVFIEVFLDYSSSWYTWDNLGSSYEIYMTINKVVNILLQSDNTGQCIGQNGRYQACFFEVWFKRLFTHDERITKYIAGQTPQQFHFSFHNQR